MNNKLPNDLRKLVYKKILKRIIPCAILLFALALLIMFFGDKIFPSDSDIYRVKGLIILAAVVIIFGATGIPFKISDPTFFGYVEKVDVTTVMDSNVPGRLSKDGFHEDNVVTLRIRTLDGKIISKTIYREKVKKSEFLDLYKAGDKVFYLFGSGNIVNLSNTNNIRCSVCYKENNLEDCFCSTCGHTLIKKLPSDDSSDN